MEILRQQAAIAPYLPHNSVAVARSGSSASSAVNGSSSCNGRRQCRSPLMVLPKITLVSALGRKQIHCRCRRSSERDGSAGVYHHAQQLAISRGGRGFCRAESHGNSHGLHPPPISFRIGASRERFQLECSVFHLVEFCRPRLPVLKSSLNGGFSNRVGDVDLELELFSFLQQSSNPDAFPTRQDLISAGRVDLVMAIEQEGGWLAAGWDEDRGTDGNGSAATGREKGTSRKRSTRKLKARSVKSSSTSRNSSRMATVAIDERNHEFEKRINGSNVVRDVVNAVDHKDGRKKDNGRTMLATDVELFGDLSTLERADLAFDGDLAVHETKSTSRPSDVDLQVLEKLDSLFRFTEELKLKRPLKGHAWGQDSARNGSVNGHIGTTIPSNFLNENCLETQTKDQVPAENLLPYAQDAVVVVAPRRKRGPRKKGRSKVANSESEGELNGTSDWIHQTSDRREKWMLEPRSNSDENSFASSLAVDSKSTENRIHTLAAKLADTRALLSVSDELWKTGNSDAEEHHGALSEFIDAEDALEFRENAIMHARNELNTTRAEVAAVEGSLKVEIMEARKILEEKSREVERARSISQHLRTARIVWPNPANEVYLTGSFNSWKSQIKMEKSSAGVFTCSLPLYPGKYEIKFVVDGSWMVDTRRVIVYIGGFENNVVTIS